MPRIGYIASWTDLHLQNAVSWTVNWKKMEQYHLTKTSWRYAHENYMTWQKYSNIIIRTFIVHSRFLEFNKIPYLNIAIHGVMFIHQFYVFVFLAVEIHRVQIMSRVCWLSCWLLRMMSYSYFPWRACHQLHCSWKSWSAVYAVPIQQHPVHRGT